MLLLVVVEGEVKGMCMVIYPATENFFRSRGSSVGGCGQKKDTFVSFIRCFSFFAFSFLGQRVLIRRGSQILCGMVLEWTSRQTLQPRWILFSWIDNLEKRADVVYSWPQNRAHKVGMVVIYFHGAAGNTTTKVKHRTNSVAPYSFTYALKRWKLTIQ